MIFYFQTGAADEECRKINACSKRGRQSQQEGDERGKIESCLKWIEGLNFEELTFWAFKDSLYNIKWRFSLREIRSYIQIRVSEKQTDAITNFEAMAKVLAIAFGSNKKGKETKIQNESQLRMALEK